MQKILIGAVTVVIGGAVALGVRNAVVERPASAAGATAVESVPPAGAMAPAAMASPGVAEAAGGASEPGAGASRASGGASAGDPSGSGRAAGRDAPTSSVAVDATRSGGSDGAASGTAGRAGRMGASASMGGGAGAGVSAAAVSGATEPAARDREAQDPDAETVLRRASAAYEAVRSLRAEFVQTAKNPLLGSEVTSRGTLYQRRPDRFLMKFSEPAGDVIVSDGSSIWIYYPSVEEDQVIRAPVGAAGAGGADLQAQFLGDPLERFTPRLEGTEPVNGRRAYVLLLTPRVATGYRSLKVWIDAEDYLVRRFEMVEDSGVRRHIELERLELNPSIPDSLFRFAPPDGVRIVERG
ncbi:MAG TPA: outer-membrane lipoprotein carrier protein LolA [Longimicrobiales bacterium]